MSDLIDKTLAELEYLALLESENYLRCEQSLSHYVKNAFKILEPGKVYVHNWHIDAICEHLEAVYYGEIKNLIINMPPRYLKSIAVTVCFPTWVWLKAAEKRFMCASYSAALSVKHSLDRRALIRSSWYQRAWASRFQLAGDQDQKTKFQNDKRGHMTSTSVGGSATGEGGDFLITDDPVNPKNAESEAERTTANNWYSQTWTTRKDDKKSSAEIIVMQRLHHEDLTGVLLKKGGYTHLNLEAEASKKTIITFPRSGRQITREPGDILFPEREGPNELKAMRVALGTAGYSAQYQQKPTPEGGGAIKEKWWKYYDLPPTRFDQVLMSWDMAFKETGSSDFVVGQVWGRVGADKYLLDQVRDRMDFVKTLNEFMALVKKWPQAGEKLIEDKANGPAVMSVLKSKISGIIAVEPLGSKVARVASISPDIEAGNVYLPNPKIYPWVDDLLEECSQFPKGAHDDQVDALSQALNRLAGFGVGDWDETEVTENLTTFAGPIDEQSW